MNISGLILRIAGWRVNITVPDYPKCIICVAPHTSNWDFIIGKLAYSSIGRNAGFLMKSSWFFFPLGIFFRAIGGIPVVRDKSRNEPSLVEQLIRRFNSTERLSLAITPEGTRKRTAKWHSGFLRIAYETHVPVLLGVLDFENKEVMIVKEFTPTGDIDEDMRMVKNYYSPFSGKHPRNFTTD